MNPQLNRVRIISLVLMVPALFLSVTGVLHSVFGVDGPNRLLEILSSHALLRPLISPFVVLGGPLIAFALNAWRVFHVSADFVNEEFVVALSIKRLIGHLVCMAVAGGLILLLMTYAFVENFEIVGR
jgi:hypothetical protein